MARDDFDASELLERLGEIRILNGQCVFVLQNKTPPEWNVVINSAGVKFFYTDGGDYTDGPRTINLGTGNNTSFFSNDPSKCVKQIFLACVVSAGSEAPVTMTWQDGAPPGQCLIKDSAALGPKSSVDEREIGKFSTRGFLELKRSF
jgi:hypothetical protein